VFPAPPEFATPVAPTEFAPPPDPPEPEFALPPPVLVIVENTESLTLVPLAPPPPTVTQYTPESKFNFVPLGKEDL
jgi:hypothetical protein